MYERSGKVRGQWDFVSRLLLSIVMGSSFLCIPAVAQEPVEPNEAPAPQEVLSQEEVAPVEAVPTAPPFEHPLKKNLLSITLGGAYWPDLGNKTLGPPSSNSPKKLSSLGFALAGAYHRHIAHWEFGDLYLGGEIGVFNFEGHSESTPSNQLITGELDGQLWYAGPSMKFMMGKGPVRYYLGGGGGYYEVSLTASDEVPRPPCTSLLPCWNTTRSLHRSTWGGFVSLGADIIAFTTESGWQWRVRLEDQIHFVNFGSLESFAPGAGNLSGPINVLQIGAVLGF